MSLPLQIMIGIRARLKKKGWLNLEHVKQRETDKNGCQPISRHAEAFIINHSKAFIINHSSHYRHQLPHTTCNHVHRLNI